MSGFCGIIEAEQGNKGIGHVCKWTCPHNFEYCGKVKYRRNCSVFENMLRMKEMGKAGRAGVNMDEFYAMQLNLLRKYYRSYVW